MKIFLIGAVAGIGFTLGLDCKTLCRLGSKIFEPVAKVAVLLGDISPGRRGEP